MKFEQALEGMRSGEVWKLGNRLCKFVDAQLKVSSDGRTWYDGALNHHFLLAEDWQKYTSPPETKELTWDEIEDAISYEISPDYGDDSGRDKKIIDDDWIKNAKKALGYKDV